MTSQNRPHKAPRGFQAYICILILLLMPALTSAWKTTIDKVHDGDTIEITRKGREVDVRFYGIDCPEKDQLYGMKAKRFFQKMCRCKAVDVDLSGQN